MPPAIGSDEEKRQDDVLSKVDALLRQHRTGILEASPDALSDDDIPLLTEIIEEAETSDKSEGGGAHTSSRADRIAVADAKAPPPAAMVLNDALIERLRPAIERAVTEALSAQLPQAIQDRVMPEVMVQLGEGLNRLRDAMRNIVRGVVQETIEQEVKRVLKALIKEREQR